MIKELRLKNWKSFEDATLYIDPLTILIGTNASGKSNALDALLFLYRVTSGMSINQAIDGGINTPALRGGLDWACLKPNNQFTIEVIIGREDISQDYKYTLTVRVNNIKSINLNESLTLLTYDSSGKCVNENQLFYIDKNETTEDKISVVFNMDDNDTRHVILYSCVCVLDIVNNLNESQRFSVFFDSVHYVAEQLKSIFVFDPVPSHMRNYEPLSDELYPDGSNIAGVLAALDENKKNEFETTITDYLKALPEMDIKRVWAETVGRSKRDAMLYCEEQWQNGVIQEIDARSMSDGTLRFLAIITAVLTREKGSLLVIEEVDNGLHPSRALILIDMLKKLGKERGIDIIVTTHNPALLDAAGGQMLPFITVAYRDYQTGVSRLTPLDDIGQLPKLMASGSLGKINTEGRIEAALKQEGI